jgi:hypothetical protein
MHSKIVLINYADGGFFESQKRNSDSALRVGKVDTVMAMGGGNYLKVSKPRMLLTSRRAVELDGGFGNPILFFRPC